MVQEKNIYSGPLDIIILGRWQVYAVTASSFIFPCPFLFFFKIGSFGNSLYQSSSTSVLLTSWNGIFLLSAFFCLLCLLVFWLLPTRCQEQLLLWEPTYLQAQKNSPCRHWQTAPAGQNHPGWELLPLSSKITYCPRWTEGKHSMIKPCVTISKSDISNLGGIFLVNIFKMIKI